MEDVERMFASGIASATSLLETTADAMETLLAPGALDFLAVRARVGVNRILSFTSHRLVDSCSPAQGVLAALIAISARTYPLFPLPSLFPLSLPFPSFPPLSLHWNITSH